MIKFPIKTKLGFINESFRHNCINKQKNPLKRKFSNEKSFQVFTATTLSGRTIYLWDFYDVTKF